MKNTYIKVKESHDPYGKGLYFCKDVIGEEVLLTHHSHEIPRDGFRVFKVHTHQDRDTIRMTADYNRKRKETNSIIGTSFDKKGRKK